MAEDVLHQLKKTNWKSARTSKAAFSPSTIYAQSIKAVEDADLINESVDWDPELKRSVEAIWEIAQVKDNNHHKTTSTFLPSMFAKESGKTGKDSVHSTFMSVLLSCGRYHCRIGYGSWFNSYWNPWNGKWTKCRFWLKKEKIQATFFNTMLMPWSARRKLKTRGCRRNEDIDKSWMENSICTLGLIGILGQHWIGDLHACDAQYAWMLLLRHLLSCLKTYIDRRKTWAKKPVREKWLYYLPKSKI